MSQKKIVSNVNERKKKQTKWTTHWFIIILKTIVNHNKTWYRSLYTKTILALTESSNVLPRWHNNNQNFHSCKIGDKSKSQSNLCEAILMRVLVEEVGKDHSSSDGKVGLFEQLSWLWSSSILFSGLQRPASVLYDQSNASLCYWTESWSKDRTAAQTVLICVNYSKLHQRNRQNLSTWGCPKQQQRKANILVRKGCDGSRGWRSLLASTHQLLRPRC